MKRNRKHIIQAYKDMNFQKKWILISFGIGIVPVLLFQLLFINVISKHMNSQMDILLLNNLRQIEAQFELTLESYTDIVYQIYADKELINNLESYRDSSENTRSSLYYVINERIKQYAEAKKGIRSISLILKNGDHVTYDNQTGSSIDNLWRDYRDLRDIEPYKKTEHSTNVVLIPTQLLKEKDTETALFYLGKKLYNTENLDKGAIATAIISIDENVLENLCNKEPKSYDDNGLTFITDSDGTIISYPQKEYIKKNLDEFSNSKKFVKSTGIFNRKPVGSILDTDEKTGWIFHNVYDKNLMMHDVIHIKNIYTIAIICDLLVSLFFITFISRYFVQQVTNLVHGLKQVEQGNLDIQLKINSKDEFGIIGTHFNQMTQRISSLIKEVEDISNKKNHAEIKALESQINPHFLYNTLDAINWMAIGKEEYEISRMLGNLGTILRYCMNQSDTMVTVEEMGDWLHSYVALYQLRYHNSFEVKIYIEEDVKSLKFYKLLLQPILENAILHGIKDMEHGKVNVDIGYSEDMEHVHFIVEDNGVGMSKEQVEHYNKTEIEKDPKARIGLSNVFERIHLYYGDQGKWHISSIDGMGTIVEIILPVDTEINS